MQCCFSMGISFQFSFSMKNNFVFSFSLVIVQTGNFFQFIIIQSFIFCLSCMLPGVQVTAGLGFFMYLSHLCDSENGDSLLSQAQPSQQVPDGIVYWMDSYSSQLPYQHYSARNNSRPLAIFDQFQHLADQNAIWSAKFPVHLQWDSNQ